MRSENISGGQDQEWRIIAMKTEDRYYNDPYIKTVKK